MSRCRNYFAKECFFFNVKNPLPLLVLIPSRADWTCLVRKLRFCWLGLITQGNFAGDWAKNKQTWETYDCPEKKWRHGKKKKKKGMCKTRNYVPDSIQRQIKGTWWLPRSSIRQIDLISLSGSSPDTVGRLPAGGTLGLNLVLHVGVFLEVLFTGQLSPHPGAMGSVREFTP